MPNDKFGHQKLRRSLEKLWVNEKSCVTSFRKQMFTMFDILEADPEAIGAPSHVYGAGDGVGMLRGRGTT